MTFGSHEMRERPDETSLKQKQTNKKHLKSTGVPTRPNRCTVYLAGMSTAQGAEARPASAQEGHPRPILYPRCRQGLWTQYPASSPTCALPPFPVDSVHFPQGCKLQRAEIGCPSPFMPSTWPGPLRPSQQY